jgi:hypothetical protein
VVADYVLAQETEILEEIEKVLNEPVLYVDYTIDGISKYHFARLKEALSIIQRRKVEHA